MTPTRDKLAEANPIDTGTGSPVAPRPDIWARVAVTQGQDTGIGSPLAFRPQLFESGDAFIPPLWL